MRSTANRNAKKIRTCSRRLKFALPQIETEKVKVRDFLTTTFNWNNQPQHWHNLHLLVLRVFYTKLECCPQQRFGAVKNGVFFPSSSSWNQYMAYCLWIYKSWITICHMYRNYKHTVVVFIFFLPLMLKPKHPPQWLSPGRCYFSTSAAQFMDVYGMFIVVNVLIDPTWTSPNYWGYTAI